MTYGWAVLIIFIVTAVFVNFGLSNPENYANDRCLFETDFSCEEFGVHHNGNQVVMNVVLSNNMPYRLNITKFEIESLSGISGDLSYDLENHNPVGVGNNFELIVTFDNPSYGIDLLKARLKIEYQIQRPGFFPKTVYGSIVSKIN